MQYPATIDKWYDQSGIVPEPVEVLNRPLFLTAAAFDRGPEKITRVYGKNFYKLFGNSINWSKYGQAALQAANIVNNGGELLIKRVVASDATLANAVIVAHVKPGTAQKVDVNGNPLYLDPATQQETTKAETTTGEGEGATVTPNEKVMINIAVLRYEVVTIPGAQRMSDIIARAEEMLVESTDNENYVAADGEFTYPLFAITDNGRGVSTKRVGFDPRYDVSKNLAYMMYKVKYLGAEDFDAEYETFSVAPGVIYLDKARDLGSVCSTMTQICGSAMDSNIDMFYDKLSELTGISLSTLYTVDVLFGKSSKGTIMQGISLSTDSYDLSCAIGFPLLSGTNGSFGDCPINTEEYTTQLCNFYDGTFDADIYNLDLYKPSVCVDANYPYAVKQKIVELAKFRKDFFFFADLGLDCNTYENAVNAYSGVAKDKFVAWYGQSYKIINPFNKRQIPVTITYSIARLLVSQLNNKTHAPYCGILHDWVIPEAIEGTVTFHPKITPSKNQKEELDNLRLNYASIINDVLTLETEYTSQDATTQLSFINNVIAIQYIIRDVRENCPKYRYSFISTNDLSKYKNNVSAIIFRYADWFESLEFVYVQDEVMKANKIFEASIKIKHKDFIQSEVLNIYTLGTEQATTETTMSSVVEV